MKIMDHLVVSTRVISMYCHLIAVIVVIFTREANIEIGLSDNASDSVKQQAHDTVFVRIALNLFVQLYQ